MIIEEAPTTVVSLMVTGNDTWLSCPYHPALPAKAKALGGRWFAPSGAWRFDSRNEDRVRALARELFGIDDTDDRDDTVTVHVPAKADRDVPSRVVVAGRIVAIRRTPASPVAFGHGVRVVSGSFAPAGGSIRQPIIGDNDVILEVSEVPRSLAERKGMLIVDELESRKVALAAERERLLARLATIESELAAEIPSIDPALAVGREIEGELALEEMPA